MSGSAFLSIDFGTTQTTAASWMAGGEPEVIPLSGRQGPMPSAVFHDGRELVVGPTALRALQSDPLMGERTPKRKLRQYSDSLEFGEHRITMLEIVSHVLSHVHGEALKRMGCAPDAVCLTRPVKWSPNGTREKILRASAVLADINCPIKIISEPEAAARQLGAEMKVGESCLVYDLGGGTCDIAVMEMMRDGLELRVEDEQEIGGETFDERLLRDVLSRLGQDDPEAARRLENIFEDPLADSGDSDVLEWRRCAAQLGENVRRAKIRLSQHCEAAVLVPRPVDREWMWSRSELDGLVRQDIAQTAESAQACVERYGRTPSKLYLAGAASAMPGVRDAIGAAIGIKPVRPDDPKAATVLGGLRTVAAPLVREQVCAAKAAELEALKQRTEGFRKQIQNSAGKALSRSALAESLEDDEVLEVTGTCTPPGSSYIKNGMYLITTKRLVWTRETLLGQPTARSLAFGDITAAKQIAMNAFGANIKLTTRDGGMLLFKEVTPDHAPRFRALAARQ